MVTEKPKRFHKRSPKKRSRERTGKMSSKKIAANGIVERKAVSQSGQNHAQKSCRNSDKQKSQMN